MAGRAARGTAAARLTRTAARTRARAELVWLERKGDERFRRQMRERFGITAKLAYGVSMAVLRQRARELGRDHHLAQALWATGAYEARMLAVWVAEKDQVTPALMEAWCRDFDSWAMCDHACFHLFDRTPHALSKARQWMRRKPEFQRRAGFAVLASVAVHDKTLPAATLRVFLPLARAAASDGRNFVKKAVSWALRSIGGRHRELHAEVVAIARELAASDDRVERWVGKDVLRDLERASVKARLAR